MAQTPGGKPRSDPARRSPSPAFTGFTSPFQRTFDFQTQGASLNPTVTIGDRTYRGVDNGRAIVLVPTSNPQRSPALLAQQRKAVVDSLFMARNPIAGAAHGISTLLGASPQTRDRAMMAGAVADAGLSVATPRGAGVRRPEPAIKAAPIVPKDGSLRYREANSKGQSQGVNAVLGAPMLGTGGGTKRRVKPPGFISGEEPYNHDRAHLLAKRLGGHADELREVFASTRNPTNVPFMSSFEREAARRVRSGEIIDYAVTPFYDPGMAAPRLVLMTMSGSRGAPAARLAENPLGRRPK